jgi:hypothetical protein
MTRLLKLRHVKQRKRRAMLARANGGVSEAFAAEFACCPPRKRTILPGLTNPFIRS